MPLNKALAKQTYHHKSGDTHEERSGNDRIQVVENKSVTTTKNKGIHHQTPTDILQNAGTNIIHEATGNIEITAKQNQIIVVEDENMEITVEGPGGMRVHIKNDELTIQSAKDINIQGNGGGDITFHQVGGGFCVTADGNVQLFGNKVQIEGNKGVRLNGAVSYVIGTNTGPSPVSEGPLSATIFKDILDDKVKIHGNHWLTQISPVGEPVGYMFRTTGMGDGTVATITVYEKDFNGKDKVDEFRLTLCKGTGTHAGQWQRPESLLMKDAEKDQQQDETGPLEYIFKVTASGTVSPYSPVLWFKKDIEIDFRKHDQNSTPPTTENNRPANKAAVENGTVIELRDPFNDYYEAEIKDDKVLFSDVLLGPTKFRIRDIKPGNPTAYDLSWSQSRVPVGKPVDATFRARNFNDGEKARINVYEWDTDGNKRLITTLTTTLEKNKNEYKVSFTRSEEQAEADLQEDEASNDKSPLAYRFEVSTTKDKTEQLSTILNLTTDIEITVNSNTNSDTEKPEKYIVECIPADGKKLSQETNRVKVIFKDVILGPADFDITPIYTENQTD